MTLWVVQGGAFATRAAPGWSGPLPNQLTETRTLAGQITTSDMAGGALCRVFSGALCRVFSRPRHWSWRMSGV